MGTPSRKGYPANQDARRRVYNDSVPELVRLTLHGNTAVVTIDNPPVNALSPGVPEGVHACIQNAAADESVECIVVIGAGRTFIAGADIREFGKITSGQRP